MVSCSLEFLQIILLCTFYTFLLSLFLSFGQHIYCGKVSFMINFFHHLILFASPSTNYAKFGAHAHSIYFFSMRLTLSKEMLREFRSQPSFSTSCKFSMLECAMGWIQTYRPGGQEWGCNSVFLGQQKKFRQSQFLKMFSSFFLNRQTFSIFT